jgi:hypothetical protein
MFHRSTKNKQLHHAQYILLSLLLAMGARLRGFNGGYLWKFDIADRQPSATGGLPALRMACA